MNEFKEKGTEISLTELWNRIWKNKIIIMIITISLVIIGLIGLFFYNKSNTVIKNNFNYSFINASENKYPDGSVYDYNDLVSKEFLNNVKSRNERFSNINVDKLLIKIRKVDDNTVLNQNEVIRRSYLEIELNIKSFNNNEDLAKLFLKEIHNELLTIVRAKNEARKITNYYKLETDLNTYLKDNLDHLTYLELIDLIRKQHNVLASDINNFIDNYGDVELDGSNISIIESDYSFWYNNNVHLSQLETEVFENNYIRNIEKTIMQANFKLNEINRIIALNETIITNLTDLLQQLPLPNEVNDLSVFYREIESRTIENAILMVEKTDLESLITFTENNIDEAFEDYINTLIIRQSNTTDEYNSFKVDYLNSITRYSPYERKEEFEVVKPFNTILLVTVLGLVGVSSGAIVALIKEASAD
ncbi:MAG TPA: hypothetical protein GX695_02130 [Acholeplasmataceae bacterium]|nr:hypothetical protein [Acholeplasmataceae bacterium]